MERHACVFRYRATLLAAAICLSLAPGAIAQTGRISGVVFSDRAEPLRGATIRAENGDSYPRSFTGTSDGKGRFSFIGLKSGLWTFTVECPGFLPSDFSVMIRGGGLPRPVGVKLDRNVALILNGPLAGVDAKLLRSDLAAADEAFAKGNVDAAISAYNSVLSRAPALTLVRLQIGNAYRQKKDDAKAAEAFEAVLAAEPANGTALYRLGEIKLSEGQLGPARELYEKAAAVEPAWTKPLLRLGSMALERGDTEAAASQLKKVMALDPQSTDAVTAEFLLFGISR